MNIEQIKAEYIEHLGSDLSVVNAARASFGKQSDWDYGEVTEVVGEDRNVSCQYLNKKLKPADANLIRFLATGYRTNEWSALLDEIIEAAKLHDAKSRITDTLKAYKRKAQHWAPFGHPHVSIRIHIPIFLARQFVKHQVGGVWSEESRRYISDEPGVWFPDEWHTRPDDIKQGSGSLVEDQNGAAFDARFVTQTALAGYKKQLKRGIAPEEARIILPLNMMTTVVWTGSLLFWSRVCNQRVDSHAQLAAQELGRKIADIVRPLYPVSWKELCE